jgi:hypothetical protein
MIRASLIALALASPAAAQQPPNCGPYAQVVAQLAEKYHETRRGMGIAGQAIAELYASDAGTWTFLVTLPDGRACAMAMGEGWEAFNEELPKGDAL